MCIGMIDASYKAFQYRPTTFLPTSFNNKKFIFLNFAQQQQQQKNPRFVHLVNFSRDKNAELLSREPTTSTAIWRNPKAQNWGKTQNSILEGGSR